MEEKIEIKENWKEGKWKITISPSDEQIRIKIGKGTNPENLKKFAKRCYKEWVEEQRQTATIRTQSYSNGRNGPVKLKGNNNKTLFAPEYGIED